MSVYEEMMFLNWANKLIEDDYKPTKFSGQWVNRLHIGGLLSFYSVYHIKIHAVYFNFQKRLPGLEPILALMLFPPLTKLT